MHYCRKSNKKRIINERTERRIYYEKVELKGIITPILTPMKEDESINTEELRNQIERLIGWRSTWNFPFGTMVRVIS